MIDPGNIKMQKIALDLFRSTFNNAFNSMINFQEQNEKTCANLIGMFFNQLECCKKESLNTFNDWIDGVQDSRHEFKSAVDEGYAKMEAIMNGASEIKKAPKTNM